MKGGGIMKNKCKFSEKTYMYLEDQLDEQQKTELLEHIKSCDSCKEEFEILNRVQIEFKELEEAELPEGYHQKLHMKLVKALNKTDNKEKKSFISYMNKLLPAAAALLVVVVTVKGVSLYNAMTAKNQNLASSAGAQMASLSLNDARTTAQGFSELQEESKTMNTAEDSVQNKVDFTQRSFKSVEDSIKVNKNAVSGLNAGTVNMKSVMPANTVPTAKNKEEDALAGSQELKAKGAQDMKSTEIRFDSLAAETQSGIENPQNIVIQSQGKFKELWDSVYKNSLPAPSVPEVDFEKCTIIAVFMGQKPTGGYGINITKIEEYEKSIVVTIKETTPEEGSMLFQVLTSPMHIVKIAKTNKDIVFNK